MGDEGLIDQQVIIQDVEFLSRDIRALVVAVDGAKSTFLLELSEALVHDETRYMHAVASAKSYGWNLQDFMVSKVGSFAIIFVPAGKYDPDKPTDVSWWRGGGATINDIKLV